MANMMEKKFSNKDLGIEMNSYIDKQQNVWFRGKDVAEILSYSKPENAIERHVSKNHKIRQITWYPVSGSQVQNPKSCPVKTTGQGRWCTFIDEAGFYELVFSSKLETAKKFRDWVFTTVLPSIRKYGQYKMFDNPNNKMFKIENETDLHYKVVQLIRNYYPDSILVAGLGENQDTEKKRLDSYKKGYQRGQPDLMILDYHKEYKGLCIEFKSPTNNYCVSESQIKMKEKYRNNDYAFILSNDYDKISRNIHKYMAGVRIPCKYCPKAFCSKKTLNKHYKVIHRIEKNI